MSLKESLEDRGWYVIYSKYYVILLILVNIDANIFFRHLSQEGIETISENGQIEDINILTKRALDVSKQKCSG